MGKQIGRKNARKRPAVDSFCGNGGCVEVDILEHSVRVWDTKDRSLDCLRFTRQEWEAFVLRVKHGRYDMRPL